MQTCVATIRGGDALAMFDKPLCEAQAERDALKQESTLLGRHAQARQNACWLCKALRRYGLSLPDLDLLSPKMG